MRGEAGDDAQGERSHLSESSEDGAGGLTQVDFVMSNDAPLAGPADPSTKFHIGEHGSYKVNPDCTGSAVIHFPAPPGVASGAELAPRSPESMLPREKDTTATARLIGGIGGVGVAKATEGRGKRRSRNCRARR